MERRSRLRVAWLGTVDYLAALELQRALLEARRQDKSCDALLLLEHPHVFTLGRGASERYLTSPPPAVPVYRVSRGGEVTYHGPGQLVGYPILKLEGAARDVHAYLRMLEQVMIEALGDLGLAAGRRHGLTGVWIGPRKIGSIGVGIRRWVTMHGFALNVCPDLGYFAAIVPCGIEGCAMTSVAAEARSAITAATFADLIVQRFAEVFGYQAVESLKPTRLAELIDPLAPACETRT